MYLEIEGLVDRPILVALKGVAQQTRKCHWCDNLFIKPYGKGGRVKYCSDECWNRSKQKRDRALKVSLAERLGYTPCRACLKAKPVRSNYCQECYDRAGAATLWAKAKVLGRCFKCGEPTENGNALCPHHHKIQMGMLAGFRERWNRETPQEVKRAVWRRYAKSSDANGKARARYAKFKEAGRCMVCGEPSHLGPGHAPYCATHKRK